MVSTADEPVTHTTAIANDACPSAGTSRKPSVLSVDGAGHRLRGALEAPVAQQQHPSGIRLRRLDLLEPGGGCAFRKEFLALPDHNRTHPQVHLVDQGLAEQGLQQVRAAPSVD